MDILLEIKKRLENSTSGIWWMSASSPEESAQVHANRDGLYSIEITDDLSDEDAEFIAHARQDIPYLIGEIEKLRNALEFYSDKENYERTILQYSSFPQYEPHTYIEPLIDEDCGKIARDALK